MAHHRTYSDVQMDRLVHNVSRVQALYESIRGEQKEHSAYEWGAYNEMIGMIEKQTEIFTMQMGMLQKVVDVMRQKAVKEKQSRLSCKRRLSFSEGDEPSRRQVFYEEGEVSATQPDPRDWKSLSSKTSSASTTTEMEGEKESKIQRVSSTPIQASQDEIQCVTFEVKKPEEMSTLEVMGMMNSQKEQEEQQHQPTEVID